MGDRRPGGLRFAVNLGMLFQEHAFLERFEAAARSGFDAVEFPRLYGGTVGAVEEALRSNGLRLVQFSLSRGDVARGERGLANDPRRRGEFREGLEWTLDTVSKLGCERISCPVGNVLADISASVQWGTLTESLQYAGERAREHGMTVLVEPLNTFDHPGILVATMMQAIQLIHEVKDENVRIMCDVYHMQRAEGNLTHTILENLRLIEHVQIADSPFRHEPGTGEINYRFVLDALADARFNGWVALEYQPLRGTTASLEWLREYCEYRRQI